MTLYEVIHGAVRSFEGRLRREGRRELEDDSTFYIKFYIKFQYVLD